jgi:hypothetical protein
VVFAFDCVILNKMMRAPFPDAKPMGVTCKALSCGLLVVIPLLAVEQLIASVLIAPKHRPSSSRNSSNNTMFGLQLYLGGIGVQGLIVVYTLVLAVIILRKPKDREIQSARTTTTVPSSLAWTRPRWTSYALVFSLGALLTRIVYRLVELSGFFTGYLLFLAHHEIFFYTLECLPVSAALGIWPILNTEVLINDQPSCSSPVGAYSYHELRGW